MEGNNRLDDIQTDSTLDKIKCTDNSNLKDEEYDNFHESFDKYNCVSILLKIFASVVLLGGFSYGLYLILINDAEELSTITTYWAVGLIIGCSVFSLFFYALGEIIRLLHSINNKL